MIRVVSLYDAVVDAEAIPDEGGRAAAEAWAKSFEGVAERMRADGADRDAVRRAAHANLLYDLHPELVQIGQSLGLTFADVIERLTAENDVVGQMPYLRQLRQLLFGRLRNAGQKWTRNDLIDLQFLSCATGYADVVIGERNAISYLGRGRGVGGARLATSLSEGVALLDG